MKRCPDCRSRLIPIVYGYPSLEAVQDKEAGKIKLGGCEPGAEKWFCPQCDQAREPAATEG